MSTKDEANAADRGSALSEGLGQLAQAAHDVMAHQWSNSREAMDALTRLVDIACERGQLGSTVTKEEAMADVLDFKQPPPADGRNWFSLCVGWCDCDVFSNWHEGYQDGAMDVWATGCGFADAVANAIRHVEGLGHSVFRVTAID